MGLEFAVEGGDRRGGRGGSLHRRHRPGDRVDRRSEAREKFEHDYLLHQLTEVGGSVGKLAKRVEMERTHLYRKLRALGIDHKKG